MSIKRVFDIIMSLTGILIFLPVFIIISVVIALDSKGGVFYGQRRVGKNKMNFVLYKFRTMLTGADKQGLLTVGDNDKRVTRSGRWLRKYKIDELPQLFN